MKSEYQRDSEAREYWAGDTAGERIYKKAKAMAGEFGEAFVVFIGSMAVPRTAVAAYSNKEEAIEAAREEASYHKGFRTAPKIHLKRIKV